MMEYPWYRHYPKHVPKSLNYPERPLFENLKISAERFPKNPAVIYKDVHYAYEKIYELSKRFANALVEMGIKKGDRVAIYLPNVPQFVIAYYGTLAFGGIVVACNALYREKELEYILSNSEARVVVTLDDMKPVVDNVIEKCEVEEIITTSRSEALNGFTSGSFSEILHQHSPDEVDVKINPKEDLAVLQYTGGTTGKPKGAMLTHYNLLVIQVMESLWFEFEEGKEVSIIFLPVSHIYGMNWCMNTMIYVAGTIVFMERFEPGEVIENVNKYKPTIFYGVPTIYIALLNHPEISKADFSHMRTCFSAAAPLPPEVRKRWKEVTGSEIIEAWGLTEASPCLTCTPLGMSGDHLIGVPMPDTIVKVVDLDTGEDLPPGEVGELVARGPQIMKGYWKNPKETEETLKNGWLRTGDLGYMSEDGLFYYVDRVKDLINVAGYKVWPDEIENVIYEHPAVLECAVVSSPDEVKGEVPKAFIVLKKEYKGRITADEIIEHCKKRLAPFKVPRKIEFVNELPKSPVGKILRRVLREKEWKT